MSGKNEENTGAEVVNDDLEKEEEELEKEKERKREQHLKELDELDKVDNADDKLQIIQNLPDSEMLTKFEYYKHLIKGRFLPDHVSRPETAFTIEQMGKELKFPLMQAMHYIIPISGKLSLSAKAIGGILKRENIKYHCTKYDVYVYNIDGDIKEYKFPLYKRDTEEHKKHYVCRLTEIKFYRKDPDGYETTEFVTFSTIDANAQGLLGNKKKPQWTRMLPEMMYARCLSRGANIIAPDKTMGLYMTNELLDSDMNDNRIENNGVIEDANKIMNIDITPD